MMAVFTISKNEHKFLPYWINHYKQFFNKKDIYVLDNDSDDGSTKNIDVDVQIVHNNMYFDHLWLVKQVEDKQKKLLETYDWVLFSETDELVFPNPSEYCDFCGFVRSKKQITYRCCGWEIVEQKGENIFDWNKSLFTQRKHGIQSEIYSKPLLTSVPISYSPGFHTLKNNH